MQNVAEGETGKITFNQTQLSVQNSTWTNLYQYLRIRVRLGLMTNQTDLQTCVNPDNQDIDVCCRDPNYEDPWPNMNGGGGGGGGGNQGRGNGFSGGNQGGGNQNQFSGGNGFSGGNQHPSNNNQFSGGNQGQQHPVQQQASPGFGNNAVQPRNGGGGGSRGGYGK